MDYARLQITKNGFYFYDINENLHHPYGPAIILFDGKLKFFLNKKNFTEEQYINYIENCDLNLQEKCCQTIYMIPSLVRQKENFIYDPQKYINDVLKNITTAFKTLLT